MKHKVKAMVESKKCGLFGKKNMTRSSTIGMIKICGYRW